MSYPTRNVTVYARKTDGYLLKASGVSYADCVASSPDNGARGSGYGGSGTSPYWIRVGQRYYTTVSGTVLNWRILRAFMSFDTGNIGLSEEIIDSAALHIAAKADNSTSAEFNIAPYSQGSTPWEPGLGAGDWAKCGTAETVLATSSIAAVDTYYSMAVAAGSINTAGLTEFRLVSSREGTDPNQGDPSAEYVDLWSARGTYPPKLVLALRVPPREAIVLNILSTLQGIDGTGNYNLDFSGTATRQVWRGFRSWDQLPLLPALCIVEGDCGFDVISASPLTYTVGSFTGVDGWLIDIIGTFHVEHDQQSAGALEKEAEKIESDVKLAMLADPLRGNSAFVCDTYHVATVGPVSFGNGMGAVRLTFAVKYDFDAIPT